MRVLVGGLHHESDTFNPIVTGEKDIKVTRGSELLLSKREDSITGIIETLEKEGVEVVPTLMARAVPNGEWDKEIYLGLKEEILERARKEEVDGICLALHGSMRIKDIGEAEGDILEGLREIKKDIPIVASLDMHATISEKMIKNADAFVGYKTAPHIDERETGKRAAELLLHALKGGKLAMKACRIPFLVAGEKSETNTPPMKELMEEIKEREKEEKILSISILMGFPWADTEDGGVSIIVVTEGDEEKAKDTATKEAQNFWSKREEFVFYNETREVEETPRRILELVKENKCPLVVSDSGDNPTAGASQDNTNLLKLLLENEEIRKMDPPLVYQAFYDPILLSKAIEKGVGNVVEGNLGAFFDKEKSVPIKIKAKVKNIYKSWGTTYKTDLALLDVEGIDVIVTSDHVGCYDPDMMKVLGIDIRKRKAVVVKLGYLEPEIRALSSSSFMALTTGSTDEVLERLPYKKIHRPIWPLDRDGDFHFEYL